MTTDDNKPSSLFDKVTVFLSGNNFFSEILKVSGILYFFGFIITRSHLLNYGITEIDLLQTKYISVGLFFIINVAIVWLPFIIQIINEIEEEKQNEKITQSPSFLISSLILFVCIIIALLDSITIPKHIFIIATLFFGSLSLIEIIILFNKMIIEFKDKVNIIIIQFREKPIILLNKPVILNKKMIGFPKSMLFIIQIITSILITHVFLYLSLTTSYIKRIYITPDYLLNLLFNGYSKFTLKTYIDDYYFSLTHFFLGWYLPLLIIGASLYFLISKKVNTDSKTILFVQARYWLITTITILTLFNIKEYSYNIYPVIPANLGGGNPTIVELILSQNGNTNFKEYLKQIELLKDSDQLKLKKLNSVFLIAQTDKYYYISPCAELIKKYEDEKPNKRLKEILDSFENLPDSCKTIQIKEEDVTSIIYK
ncbi:hypothetical protein [Planktothrix agardhii]|uniref:hypothetical protein n=1 Tax=Planktothrix agardhii TaxID=1160 RepID=UPI0028743B13|nr:hypothetical protein [Planktothrix agardhii]MDS1347778.1 hypothetical protein [Planktothrix agardhii NRERC-751]